MTLITLSDIKAQCRIDSNVEDALLSAYGDAAEETITQLLGRGNTVAEMKASLEAEYTTVPQSIKNAALMLVDVWYQHRSPVEPVSLSIVPYTFDILIKPYMIL